MTWSGAVTGLNISGLCVTRNISSVANGSEDRHTDHFSLAVNPAFIYIIDLNKSHYERKDKRQTDRQTDRQTETETQRERHTHTEEEEEKEEEEKEEEEKEEEEEEEENCESESATEESIYSQE